MELSPLALTDEELERIEAAALAAALQGCRVEKSGHVGKGKSNPKYLVIAPALRNRAEETVASFNRKADAEFFVLAADHLAFLAASLQSARAETDKAAHELSCVVASLDTRGVPIEIAPGQPYTVHGRVLAALDSAHDAAATKLRAAALDVHAAERGGP